MKKTLLSSCAAVTLALTPSAFASVLGTGFYVGGGVSVNTTQVNSKVEGRELNYDAAISQTVPDNTSGDYSYIRDQGNNGRTGMAGHLLAGYAYAFRPCWTVFGELIGQLGSQKITRDVQVRGAVEEGGVSATTGVPTSYHTLKNTFERKNPLSLLLGVLYKLNPSTGFGFHMGVIWSQLKISTQSISEENLDTTGNQAHPIRQYPDTKKNKIVFSFGPRLVTEVAENVCFYMAYSYTLASTLSIPESESKKTFHGTREYRCSGSEVKAGVSYKF